MLFTFDAGGWAKMKLFICYVLLFVLPGSGPNIFFMSKNQVKQKLYSQMSYRNCKCYYAIGNALVKLFLLPIWHMHRKKNRQARDICRCLDSREWHIKGNENFLAKFNYFAFLVGAQNETPFAHEWRFLLHIHKQSAPLQRNGNDCCLAFSIDLMDSKHKHSSQWA